MGNSSRCCHRLEEQDFAEAKSFPTLEKEGIIQRTDPQLAFSHPFERTVELTNAEEPVVVSYLELLRDIPDSADSKQGSSKPVSNADPASTILHEEASSVVNKKASVKSKVKPKAKTKNKLPASVESKPKDSRRRSSTSDSSSGGGDISPKSPATPLRPGLVPSSLAMSKSSSAPTTTPKLSVFVMSASGLRNADVVGKSDPFCTVELKGLPRTRVKTSVKNETLAPQWNEGFELAYKKDTDLLFRVWDADTGNADDPLGEAILEHQAFKDGFNGDLLLTGEGVGDAFASLHVKAIVSTSHYISAEGVDLPRLAPPGLTIRILSAKGLRNADMLSKSDPYCICRFSGMSGSTISTEVIPDSLDPKWNATFRTPYFPGKDLYFEVWDKDTLKDDFLGKTFLKAAAFHPDGFKGSLPLLDAGKGITATIDIEVKVHKRRQV